MTAKNKLDEAQFFLDKINKAPVERSEWRYYFSAFLSSVRSVPDHLLYDYANKCGLGISLKDRVYTNVLKDKAEAQSNKVAIKFIEWYIDEWTKLSNDKIVKVFVDSRNIENHRGTLPLESSADLAANFTIPDRVELVPRDKDGRVIQKEVANSKTTSTNTKISEVTPELPELQGEPVHNACKKILGQMENLVDEAHQRFP